MKRKRKAGRPAVRVAHDAEIGERISHARAAHLAQLAALPNAAARADAAERERMQSHAAGFSRQLRYDKSADNTVPTVDTTPVSDTASAVHKESSTRTEQAAVAESAAAVLPTSASSSDSGASPSASFSSAALASPAERSPLSGIGAEIGRRHGGRGHGHVWTGRAARAAGSSPLVLKLLFVLLLTFSALGEWKKINNALGGLPKIITAGIIVTALAYAIIRPNLARLRELLPPTLMYFGLIAFLLIWSLVIWILNFSDLSSMVRGCSKMLFQTVSMLTAVSAVYMFGIEAIDLFSLGLGAANGFIMLLEIPNYGVAASIRSLITCIVTFGDAEGYARSLEIHDLTFVFGQLLLYYAIFAPTETEDQRRRRRHYILLTGFFFIIGMKRIAIPAVVLFGLLGLLLRKRKRMTGLFVFIGIAWTAFFFLYIYGVRTGAVSHLLGKLGIDTMGREYLWQLANRCYTFSPAYMGKGFEFIDTMVGQWYRDGLLKLAYAFHNDILKVFVEIGFPGLMLWSLTQYVAYPVFWVKYADTRTALLYVCELGYMTVSYLTDNTAFYFWCTMALRLVTLAYATSRRRAEPEQTWQPLDRRSVRDLIGIMMNE